MVVPKLSRALFFKSSTPGGSAPVVLDDKYRRMMLDLEAELASLEGGPDGDAQQQLLGWSTSVDSVLARCGSGSLCCSCGGLHGWASDGPGLSFFFLGAQIRRARGRGGCAGTYKSCDGGAWAGRPEPGRQ